MAKKATKKKPTQAKKGTNSAEKALVSKSRKRSPGRPAGSQNIDRPVSEGVLSICSCGSTERRTVGQGPLIQAHEHIHHGNYYTHIVRRRVVCSRCGQQRMEITRENRGPEKK